MIALMRVKDEARWIQRCVESILPVCDRVLVMDDHSSDGTPDICAGIPGVRVLASPFDGLDETRDKRWLVEQARPFNPGHVLMIDGDEMLAPDGIEAIREALKSPFPAWSFRVLYLWDSETQARIDGVYGRFWRPSMWRLTGDTFESSGAGGNFHCGNVPLALHRRAQRINANLLHFGYMDKADRIRKYHWYNSKDPNNSVEDKYVHMVIGDLPEFPPTTRRQWGGPLEIRPVSWI